MSVGMLTADRACVARAKCGVKMENGSRMLRGGLGPGLETWLKFDERYVRVRFIPQALCINEKPYVDFDK